jgi:4-hydroxybenzoate polyprenyltransferase
MTGGLGWRLLGVVRTMRPHQWVKNVFVLAPVVFAKDFFHPDLLVRAFGAFGVFCLLASAVYTLNDLVDVEADRAHPVKRYRPIACERVPVPIARALAVVLVIAALGGAAVGPVPFLVVALSYFLLNVAYSFKLKKIAYLDVACIAAGFVLRVVGGGFAAGIYVSWYLLACTALLALFLGFGKRRHELAHAMRNGHKSRVALNAYTPRALTMALAGTGVATVATYVAYTLDPATRKFFHSDWLWLTTPFTIIGVVRFLRLVAHRPKAESPTQAMLRDGLFVFNLVAWVIVVFAIVYRLRPEASP